MLTNKLFIIKEKTTAESNAVYCLSLNASHPIFQAHFSGNPVMPGACIVQMIKELSVDYLNKTLTICEIRNTKFLSVINPLENQEITVKATFTAQDANLITVSAVISDKETVFSKVIISLKSEPLLQELMDRLGICVVIPSYNNGKTLYNIINELLKYTNNIIVVNDGSTDDSEEMLKVYAGRIKMISYARNRGKGYALSKGFDLAEDTGYKNVITIDADGQHFASETEQFVKYAEKYPDAFLLGQRIITGEMPSGNSFANKFSNFWFTVQTSYQLTDTQNGFRLYPLKAMRGLRPLTSRYEAELEMLVRSAWRGVKIIPVPVQVYYPPANERVTHFRPGMDFFRISLLNTALTVLAIIYGYPSMFFRKLFNKNRKA